jgi:bifunctional DNase/RNase
MLEYNRAKLEVHMPDMVVMVIDSIRVSLVSQQRIVILREIENNRYLPIWIGIYEAEAIAVALQEVEVSRPLTHDLLKNIFKTLRANIMRVEIVALRDDTFYGNIVVETNEETIDIDARPSDALALAVRTHVPILVERSVLDSAGIVPEQDLRDKEEKTSTKENIEENPERLSVFEDFLAKLDHDKKNDDPQAE